MLWAHFRLRGATYLDERLKETKTRFMAIETPGEKRNLNKNINAQQAILNAYITNNSTLPEIWDIASEHACNHESIWLTNYNRI